MMDPRNQPHRARQPGALPALGAPALNSGAGGAALEVPAQRARNGRWRGGLDADAGARARTSSATAIVAGLERAMRSLNRVVVIPCMAALIVAAAVLTYSVVARYFLKVPTDWQDETSVFLLVGATFLSSAYVQAQRGHVAIELLSSLLSPRLNGVRLVVVDLVSLAFCAFFAWKSWTLLRDAWVDGQTSNSSFGPPMWIPYSLMALGMTLLSLQLLVGLLARLTAAAPESPPVVRPA